jgi:acyl-CoA dehydrogenase
MAVTDFPHVRRLFTDAYARLVAMKLVALRAADYMRVASPDDRRYLLYNPVVKMKVTTQGEEVINHLWDVIAAKGFEADMYFEMAARDIRALPKLEGTVHVNIALIVKFMENYFFHPVDLPEVGRRDEAVNDDFLFDQGPTRGLGKIRFHDYAPIFKRFDAPNVTVFAEQAEVLKRMLVEATPTEEQQRDTDWLLAVGELFTLVVYGQLVLENAEIYDIEDDLVDQIFDVAVRDFSRFAVDLNGRAGTTADQSRFCMEMIRKPVTDDERAERIWDDHVFAQRDAYQMAD